MTTLSLFLPNFCPNVMKKIDRRTSLYQNLVLDVSTVLLHDALKTTLPFTDCYETFSHARLGADQISNKHGVRCCSYRLCRLRLPSSCLSITAAVGFIQQPVRTGSAPHLMLKIPYQSSKARSRLVSFAKWRRFAI